MVINGKDVSYGLVYRRNRQLFDCCVALYIFIVNIYRDDHEKNKEREQPQFPPPLTERSGSCLSILENY